MKTRSTVRGRALALLALAFVACVTLPGAQRAAAEPTKPWQQLPLVTQAMRDAGLAGGEGGQVIRAIEYSPADANVAMLGIDVAGVFRSLDGGTTWRPANVGWSARGANGFALDPRNSSRMLGIGGNSTDDPSNNRPNGIYLSTDQGASWSQKIPSREGFTSRDTLAYDPSSFDSGLNCTRVAYWASRDDGIYKTSDCGNSWAIVNANYRNVLLKVHPTLGYVYLTAANNPDFPGTGTAAGFYKSVDGGLTFSKKNDAYTLGIDVSRAAPDRVYLSRFDRVLVSNDAGETFSQVGGNGLPPFGKPMYDITASPADANYLSVWAGDYPQDSIPRLVSFDGGANWQQIDPGNGGKTLSEPGYRQVPNSILPFNVRVGVYAYHPTNRNIVLHATSDWVSKSTDGGKTYAWNNNGNNGIFVTTFNFSPTSPNTVLLGSQDWSTFLTTNGGSSWTYTPASFAPPDNFGGYTYGAYAVDGQTMWTGDVLDFGNQGDAVLKVSTDGGQTWTLKQSGGANIVLAGSKSGLTSYSDPTDNRIGFAANWRTTDKGATWTQMTGADAVYIANPTGAKELYGRKDSTLVKSTDRGATWQTVVAVPGGFGDVAYDQVNNRFWLASEDTLKLYANGSVSVVDTPKDQYNTTRVRSVAVDPVDPRIIYAVNSRDLWSSTNSVIRSVDGGQTWENLTITTPIANANATSGPREGFWVRVHPQTREAWVATSCFGMWKIAAPGGSTGIANGEYTLTARHSGKALEVPGASTANAVQVTQNQANSATNQRWIIESVGNSEYTIKAKHSGKLLDVAGNSTTEGTAIIQYQANGGANQRWRIEPTNNGFYRIVSVRSGLVVDVTGGSGADGAPVAQYGYGGGFNQQWRLVP